MEAALYGEGGFFASGGGSGRAGRDFITSPHVGSLFGVCVARALDRYWVELERPDPLLVVEAGAGDGQLARDVLRAQPECLAALRYVLVERSDALRAKQRERLPLEPADEALGPFVRRTGGDEAVPAPGAGPVFAAIDELPAIEASGVVVFANELLDNLPFGIAQWDGVAVARGADRVRATITSSRCLVPDPSRHARRPTCASGARVPIPRGLQRLVRRARPSRTPRHRCRSSTTWRRWPRSPRGRGCARTANIGRGRIRSSRRDRATSPGTSPSSSCWPRPGASRWSRTRRRTPGSATSASTSSPTPARNVGGEGAARGDLAALAGRSLVHEAAALTDPAGLGAHRVVVLAR